MQIIFPLLLTVYAVVIGIQLNKEGGVFRFWVIGMCVELAMFQIVYAICLAIGGRASTPANLVYGLYIVTITVVCLAIVLRRRLARGKSGAFDGGGRSARAAMQRLFRPHRITGWHIAFIVIAALQMLRLIFGQVLTYRDDKTYIALINDMVYTNRFYQIYDYDGSMPAGGVDLTLIVKYLLSSWYAFQAMCCSVTGLHPLIVCKTIIPPLVLLASYAALAVLAEEIFPENILRQGIFLTICAFLYESVRVYNDFSYILLDNPMWGKNLAASIVVPLVLAVFIHQSEQEEPIPRREFLHNTLLLFILVLAGCASSVMAVMIVSIEVGVGMLFLMVRHRRWNYLLQGMAAVIPVAVEGVIYLLIKAGRIV